MSLKAMKDLSNEINEYGQKETKRFLDRLAKEESSDEFLDVWRDDTSEITSPEKVSSALVELESAIAALTALGKAMKQSVLFSMGGQRGTVVLDGIEISITSAAAKRKFDDEKVMDEIISSVFARGVGTPQERPSLERLGAEILAAGYVSYWRLRALDDLGIDLDEVSTDSGPSSPVVKVKRVF